MGKEAQRGIKQHIDNWQSSLIALGIVVAMIAWLVSGQYKSESSSDSSPAVSVRDKLTQVRVRLLESRRINQEIVFSGHTEPVRAVTMRAEIDGRVVELGAKRGTPVRRGDLIARIDMRDRQARLKQAAAVVDQRRIEFDAASALQKRNLQSETLLAQARANLSAAEALVEQIKIGITNTILYAPFDGVLDRRPIEIGTFVKLGDEVARILDQNPIRVVGSVTQQDRPRLVLGDRGVARLITGEVVTGHVTYIATEADEATRTFRVELEAPNIDGTLVAGATAEIRIPVRTITAYQLSPALLSQDRGDVLGVKTVTRDGIVEFHPVEVIRSTPEGLWVSGLPREARIITVGQGFVRAGEQVRAIAEEVKGSQSTAVESADSQ